MGSEDHMGSEDRMGFGGHMGADSTTNAMDLVSSQLKYK
jgi:hypothetical protein